VVSVGGRLMGLHTPADMEQPSRGLALEQAVVAVEAVAVVGATLRPTGNQGDRRGI
jgi:hypothetical protein